MGIMFERMWFSQFLMGFIQSERFPEATVWTLSWTASQHRVCAASRDLAPVNSSVCLQLKKQALCQVSGNVQGENISLVK